ncbi:MAG TPA: DUF4389 domain-containing protein, partial [Gaiellaceae bacterium]
KPFQRFTAAFLRYATTVGAYLLLVANPFPGFTGERGRYPVELEVPTTPEKQNRLKTFFRIILVYPAVIVAYLTMFVVFLVYPLIGFAWWASMIKGRMPRGFRDLGANVLRYFGQIYAYLFLVTGTYPCSSPYVGISFEEPVVANVPVTAEAPAAIEAPVAVDEPPAVEAPPAAEEPAAPEAPEAPPET